MLTSTTLGVIVLVGILLYGVVRYFPRFPQMVLRRLPGSDLLVKLRSPGRESAHVTLGTATLIGESSQSTVAGWQIMHYLLQGGIGRQASPMVTVGEATQLPLVQATLRHAYRAAGVMPPPVMRAAQFVASEGDTMAYAAAAADGLRQAQSSGSVVSGRIGAEVALLADAARTQDTPQVVATSDVRGAAVAYAFTSQVMIGEELLTAPSFLEPRADRSAALIVMDIMRWLIAGAITGLVLYQLLVG